MNNEKHIISLGIILDREYTPEELEEIFTEISWAAKHVDGIKYAEFIEEV